MKTVISSWRVRAAIVATLVGASAAADTPSQDLSNLDLQSLMQMDIILVNAQKRVENVDRVPISMTVMQRHTIQGARLDSTHDLQFGTPGLTTTGSQALMLPFIRGVGTDVITSGVEPSVATYVDGVYQSDRAMTFVDLADAEQIEILKGPQGTLYGRNATGGAINITTRGPTDALVADAQATSGNFNLRDVSMFVAGPVAEPLKLSLSAHVRNQDGTYTNIANGEDVNGERFYSLDGRAQLDITATLRAEVLMKYFSRDNSAGYATELSGNSIPALLGYAVATRPYQTASNMSESQTRMDSTTIALKLNWDGSWAHLQSISAQQHQRHQFGSDFDASTATIAQALIDESSSVFTQELQLTPAHRSERWDWLLGGFYIDSVAGMSPLSLATAGPAMGVVTAVLTGEVKTKAYAAFGDATYALTPAFSLTGGLRLSYEQQQLDDVSQGLLGMPLQTFPERSHDWHDLSYRLIARYTLERTFFYAKTESGFKSGSYNNVNPGDPGPIDPEQITAYEIGVKYRVPESALRVSAAVFYNDYRDLQIQAVDGTTRAAVRVQAPRAEIYGAEAGAEWKATGRWSISAGTSWLHAVYREFTSSGLLTPNPFGGNAIVPNLNLAGRPLSRSPEFTGNIATSYTYPMDAGDLVGMTDYYRSSRLYFYPTSAYSQESFGIVNASLQYRSHQHWNVSLWGKNLTDQAYLLSVVPSQLGTGGEYAMPRTYGVSVGCTFGN